MVNLDKIGSHDTHLLAYRNAATADWGSDGKRTAKPAQRMLFETACRLRDDVGVHSDVVLKNSVIESFTIHARNVAAFLYPDRPNAR